MIKLEIPLEAETLTTTANMLLGLAASLKGENITPPAVTTELETLSPPTPAPTTTASAKYGESEETAAVVNAIETALPGVDLDSTGLPWDGRIHSAGKTKLVKDQTWKKKRGLDPALVLQVETELRQAMAAPAATATLETTPPPAETDQAPTLANLHAPVADASIPPLADTQVPPASTTPPPATTTPPLATTEPLTFPLLMSKVTNAISLGAFTLEDANAAAIKNGLASIVLLSARPDLIDAVNAELFPNV